MKTQPPVLSDREQEIVALHNGIIRNLRESLDMATARKIEIGKHFCCALNMAWHRGMASLPQGWQRLLKEDGIIPAEEPNKVCGGCWLKGS